MSELLAKRVPTLTCNVASPPGNRHWAFVRRIARAARAWLLLVRYSRSIAAVYVGLSSGLGQVLDGVLIALCRLLGKSLVVHHHNYSYLRSAGMISQCVMRLAGSQALHVLLCPDMEIRFLASFPGARLTLVLSNASILSTTERLPSPVPTASSGPIRIGYLSALSSEKGFDDFLALARQSIARWPGVEFVAAGNPPTGVSLEALRRTAAESGVQLSGPVYGESKWKYLGNLDLLIFPSAYPHEAEPLVIHEALGCGATVVSYEIGCTCQYRGHAAVTLAERNRLPEIVAGLIERFSAPAARSSARGVAQACARSFADDYSAALRGLIARLAGAAAPTI